MVSKKWNTTLLKVRNFMVLI